VDGDGLALVVEDYYFKKPAGSIGADVEVSVALVEHADGVAYRVLDVQTTDAVLVGVVRDLHGRRLPCLGELWQVNLPSRRVPWSVDRSSGARR